MISSKQRRRTRLEIERLESRQLLAAGITTSLVAAPSATGPSISFNLTPRAAVPGSAANTLSAGTGGSSGFLTGSGMFANSLVTPLVGPPAQLAVNLAPGVPTAIAPTLAFQHVPGQPGVSADRLPYVPVVGSIMPDQGYFLFGNESTLRDAFTSDLPPGASQGDFRLSAPVAPGEAAAPGMVDAVTALFAAGAAA